MLRPFLAWSKAPPATGAFAVMLIVVMFVAPYGLVGMWNRLARRVVAIVPTPAGSATALLPATDPDIFEPTDNTTPEGDE